MLLLLPAPALLAVGLAQLALVRTGQTTVADIQPALYSAAVLLACSVVLSLCGFRGDQILFPLAALLTVVGLLFTNRLEPAVRASYGAVGQRQWQWASLSPGVFLLILLLTRRWVWRGRVFSWDLALKRYRYIVLFVGLALVIAAMLFGVEVNGARLWLRVGSLQFQPSELFKVLLVAFLAAYLEDKRDLVSFGGFRLWRIPLPPIPYLLPLLFMLGLSLAVLAFQRDLGAAMLTFGTFLGLLYVASSRLAYLLAGGAAFGGAVVLLNRLTDRVAALAHVRTRIAVWLSPWTSEGGYQVIQGLYALASGGLFGQGLGQGAPTLIPESHTDLIFAAIGEEWGLLGTTALLVLYAILIGRGLSVSLQARDGFLQLLGVGLTIALAVQILIIVGGNLVLIPLTGITLPFVSYGGSSLLMNWVVVGVLVRISAQE
jgi:cell division protein FtsW (lipid II flippase)